MKKLDYTKLTVATQLAAGMLANPMNPMSDDEVVIEALVKKAHDIAEKLIDACTDETDESSSGSYKFIPEHDDSAHDHD